MTATARHPGRRSCRRCTAGRIRRTPISTSSTPSWLEQDLATWRAEIARTDGIVAVRSLDDTIHSERRGPLSLRWVLWHVFEEYARHNGHADIIREAIDGAVGE